MNAIENIYSQMLDKQELDEFSVNRIANYALHVNSENLIIKVLQNKKLNSQMDGMFRDLKGYKIRVAWVQSPGRTVEEQKEALQKERRQNVLTALAEAETLDADMYATIAKRATSPKVSSALIRNDKTPMEALRLAAKSYGENIGGSRHGKNAEIAELFDPFPDIHEDLISGAADTKVIFYVAGNMMLSEKAQLKVVTRIVKELENLELRYNDSSHYTRYTIKRHFEEACNAARNFLSCSSYEKEYLDLCENSLRKVRDPVLKTSAVASLKSSRDSNVLKFSKKDMLSKDPSILTEIASELRATENEVGIRLFVKNEALTADHIWTVIPVLNPRTLFEVLKNRETDVEIAGIIFAEIAKKSLWLLNDSSLSTLSNPAEIFEAGLNVMNKCGTSANLRLVESIYAPENIALQASIKELTRAIMSPVVRDKTWDSLREILGDDVKKWEVFESLASDNHDGTIEDLLQICDVL